MRGRINGGMVAALLLFIGVWATQTQAWTGGEHKEGNTVAINKSATEAAATPNVTEAVTQSPTWRAALVLEPLKMEEGVQDTPVETKGAVTTIEAAWRYVGPEENKQIQYVTWWQSEKNVVREQTRTHNLES